METEKEMIIEMCQTRSLGCPQCYEDIGSHVDKTCDTKIQSIVKIWYDVDDVNVNDIVDLGGHLMTGMWRVMLKHNNTWRDPTSD